MSHFPPLYLTISRTVNAPRRLESLRNSSIPDWRKARAWNLANGANAFGALSQSMSGNVATWSCCTGPQFRNERFADEIDGANIDHTGWFSDVDGSRKIRGIVARLPHGLFIAGTYSTDNGMRTYWPEIYTDECDAASDADTQAENDAASERDYDERYQAARDLDEEIEQRETDISELFPMRHHARARRELVDAIDSLRTMRARRDDEYSDIDA